MNILFVCTGNIARSPMAEAIARQKIAKRGLSRRFKLRSAGTFAARGTPVTKEAVHTLQTEYGLRLRHRAQQLTQKRAEWADLILTMGREHIEQVLAIAPFVAYKLHTLAGYAAGISGKPPSLTYNISDCYGAGLAAYKRTAAAIDAATQKMIDRLESSHSG